MIFSLSILATIVGGNLPLYGNGMSPFISQNQLSPPNGADMSGTFRRIGLKLYAQNLGPVPGLSIEGINQFDGETNTTDVLMAGTTGSSSWRGLQGYYANTSTSLPHIRSGNDNSVTDMVKVEDADGNMDLIYIERGTTDGRMVKQRGVDPTHVDGVSTPDWELNIYDNPLESMCMGDFFSDAELDIAAISTTGKIIGIDNLVNPGGYSNILNWDEPINSDFRFVKNTIEAIDDLDGFGPGTQDLITGHGNYVYAISANFSAFPEIWNQSVGSRVGSVLPIPDISADGLDDVVAVTANGIYLLEGKNGTIIWSNTTAGAYFRDVQLFNDVNDDGVREIITGNSVGQIFIIDVNPLSDDFGILVNTAQVGSRYIGSILEIEDLTGNGRNEYAIGGQGVVSVLDDNGTKYWSGSAIGAGYWLSPAYNQIWDIALLDDQDGDNYKDIAVVGGYETQEGAIFIFSAQGQLEFQPDLVAYSLGIDINCSNADHEFIYQATAKQANNLVVSAYVTIDTTEYSMMPNASNTAWDEGVEFTYSTTLDEGNHTYGFRFTDTNGNELIIPSTSSYNGPSVGDNCDGTPGDDGGLNISSLPGLQIGISLVIIGLISINLTKKFKNK
jgi:hypothetical protein